MAGDWIPMRTDLAEDPAVIAIAAALDLDEFGVVGRLHRLWSWANRQLVDGHAPNVTSQWVDRFLCTPGFAAAMLDAGWLQTRSGGISLPHFDRWNSQGAKQRHLATQRKRSGRSVSPPDRDGRHAASVTKTRPEDRTGEERRGEEDTTDPPTPRPSVGRPVEAFDPLRAEEADRKRFEGVWATAGLTPLPNGRLTGTLRGLLLSALRDEDWAKDWEPALRKAGTIPFLAAGLGRQKGPLDPGEFLRNLDLARQILAGVFDPRAPAAGPPAAGKAKGGVMDQNAAIFAAARARTAPG